MTNATSQFQIKKDKTKAYALIAVFAVVGVIALLAVSAASDQPTFEAESASSLVTATVEPDPEASGGNYILFEEYVPEPLPEIAELDCNDPMQRFVAINGSPDAAGSCEDPWDLVSTLADTDNEKVQPGTVIWVREGRYKAPFDDERFPSIYGVHRYFISNLLGTAEKPIVVRAVPGERVTLWTDGAEFDAANVGGNEPGLLEIAGNYTWYWGLEISFERKNKDELNSVTQNCRGGNNRIGGGIGYNSQWILSGYIYEDYRNGPTGNKIINVVEHDGNGIAISKAATRDPDVVTEHHGNITYYAGRYCKNNGRYLGHGSYLQKESSNRHYEQNNIVFDPIEWGYHMWSSNNRGVRFTGNTIFNTNYLQIKPSHGPVTGDEDNSVFSGDVRAAWVVGGPFQDGVASNNYVYHRPLADNPLSIPVPSRGIDTSFGSHPHTYFDSTSVHSYNYAVGGWGINVPENVKNATIENNTSIGSRNFSSLAPNNNWIDSADPSQYPTENEVFLQINKFEKGRTNITIYNWEDLDQVVVDLASTELEPGQKYEVRDVQNFFGAPVATGTYQNGGDVSIPMRGLTKVQPIASETFRQDIPHTAPFFGVFVVVPVP